MIASDFLFITDIYSKYPTYKRDLYNTLNPIAYNLSR